MSKQQVTEKAVVRCVPQRRFPEFRGTEGWEVRKLSEVALFVKEKKPIQDFTLENYISTENILAEFMGATSAKQLPIDVNVTHYKKGDVLVSNIRPYLKKIWLSNKNGGASNDVIVIRATDKVGAFFLSFILKNENFIDYMMQGAKGVKMPRGDIDLVKKYPIALPTLPEQQHIAACLSSLDDLINAESQQLTSLKTHKQGLMQQLFPREGESVPRVRFEGFEGDWEARKLDDFITERSLIAQGDFPLYSLTIENGVTPKTERYERAFLVADEENAYKIVKNNDFAFNPMNLRFGAIARHKEEKAVTLSKYYNIFFCDSTVSPDFCEIYFKTRIMIKLYNDISTGTLVEKKRVHFSEFLKLKILFPTLPEQQRIAACLSSLDDLITAQAAYINTLKQHKKGLMQQLFPSVEQIEA